MATKATHTKRLLKLADILAKFRPKKGIKFDMAVWGRHDVSHVPSPQDGFCGTAACALGHGAMDPAFRRAGLKLWWTKLDRWYDCEKHCVVESPTLDADVRFGGSHGEYAGAKFFGLSTEEAEDVFIETDVTKAQVTRKLRKYARRREELGGVRS
jgi:hypothetical protein